MKTRALTPWLLMASALACCDAALAHAPVFDCYLEHPGQVKCEAGYTDGSSAAGRKIQVLDASDKVLLEGSIAPDNSYSFQAPDARYRVEFMGGDNHRATIQSSDITQ